MHSTMADAHHPNLGLGNAGAELVSRLQLIAVKLERSRFDVDHRELILVGGLELGADLVLVDGVPTPRELFFAIAAFDRAHYQPPLLGNGVREICARRPLRMPGPAGCGAYA